MHLMAIKCTYTGSFASRIEGLCFAILVVMRGKCMHCGMRTFVSSIFHSL